MEPITTTAITTLVMYLGGKAFDKAFDTVTGEFTKDSVKWLKSILFKENKPKEVLEKYQEKPDSGARQNAIKSAIEIEVEDNPQAEKHLLELFRVIEGKLGNQTIVTNSQNVNMGAISSNGNVTFGNNNSLSD